MTTIITRFFMKLMLVTALLCAVLVGVSRLIGMQRPHELTVSYYDVDQGVLFLSTTNGVRAAVFTHPFVDTYDWSPDGEILIVKTNPVETNLYDYRRILYRIDPLRGIREPLDWSEEIWVSGWRWSPDSQQLAFLVVNDPSSDFHRQDIFITGWGLTQPHRLTNMNENISNIAWSANGEDIRFVYADKSIDFQMMVNIATGEIRPNDGPWIPHRNNYPMLSSHDRMMIADFSGNHICIRMIRSDKQSCWLLPPLHPNQRRGIPLNIWSPDDRWLLITRVGRSFGLDSLSVISVETGEIRTVVNSGHLNGVMWRP